MKTKTRKAEELCSNPIPISPDVVTSCRKCDECTNTRIQGWVARCMAEKATMGHVYAVTLTYSEDTEHTRNGARAFRYSDVRLFLAGLRSYIRRSTGQAGVLRFVCCGEMGSKRGRVHWHIVLFSQVEIRDFGTWTKHGKPYAGEKEGKNNRLNWSCWPHGYVVFQLPDDNGLAYVLKYATKDQFEGSRSKGTKRYAQSENFAASYFRMSKRPAIGWVWLQRHLDEIIETGQFPTSMCFKVPNYWGYWYPTGLLRIDILRYLNLAAQSREALTGRRPAQEAAFIASLSEAEQETYHGGQPGEEEEEAETRRARASAEGRERAAFEERRKIRRRCGGCYPCEECLAGLGDAALAEIARHAAIFAGEQERPAEARELDARWRLRYPVTLNRWCALRAEPEVREAFDGRAFFGRQERREEAGTDA